MFTPCSPRLLLVAALFTIPFAGRIARDAGAARDELRELTAEEGRTAVQEEQARRFRDTARELTASLSSGRLGLNDAAFLLQKVVRDCRGFYPSLYHNAPAARTEREVYARSLIRMVGQSVEGSPARAATLERLEAEYETLEEREAWPGS